MIIKNARIRKSIILVLLPYLLTFQVEAQIILNGTIDSFEEMSRIETHPIQMDDGTILMMDFYIPITQDCVVTMINIPGIGDVPIQIIARNTQYLIYDSIDNQINPNPYRLPLIFTRTPYNKDGDDLGPIFAFMGYAYGAQDMRGTNASSGVYYPMYSDAWNKNDYHPNIHYNIDISAPTDPWNANKHEDGIQTLDLLLNDVERIYDYDNDLQPDTFLIGSGSLGMIGASALGNSQYTLAATRAVNPNQQGLQSIMPLVASADHYLYTITNNGVYRQALVDNWISGQMNNLLNDALNPIDTSMMNNLHSSADYGLTNKAAVADAAIDFLLVEGSIPGYYPNSPLRASMDVSYAPVDALGNADSNGVYSRYRNMNVPAYHLSGWWDIFVDGQIQSFNAMRNHAQSTETAQLQKLVVGPWAHQTVGSLTTGDATYPSNVMDVLGINVLNTSFSSFDTTMLADLMQSELYGWFRYTINQKAHPATTEPKFIIPESHDWQYLSSTIEARVPSEDYIVPYTKFIQYIAGQTTLDNVQIEIRTSTGISPYTYSLPVLDPPIIPMNDTIQNTDVVDFMQVPAVRLYMVGPLDDGVPENQNCGNYWVSCDSFPFSNGIHFETFYLHQNNTMDNQIPSTNEGSLSYTHDPDNPVLTVGGANMTIQTPQGTPRYSQGQMDLANPLFAPYTMNHPGVIQFTSGIIQDSLRILGFPTATLYAQTDVAGGGPTDADFFVRILDVYPDGREMFVVEGCVNARAREYVRSLYNDNENINAPYSNINSGSIYEYQLKMMPIGYVWGKNHRVKVLISSGNYPRYQSNPNLPIQDNEFFRRKPSDGQQYLYQGNLMSPRMSVQSICFSPTYPSHIQLPILDNIPFSIEDDKDKTIESFSFGVYPNPASESVSLHLPNDEALVQIYTVNAQLISETKVNQSVIVDVSNYSPGIYIIKYISEKYRYAEKLIVF
jgi:predicted acyl esterase